MFLFILDCYEISPTVILTVHHYDFSSCLLSLRVQLMMENVLDVLCVADMYLLPGLKRLCGKTLAKSIGEDNVLHMWKTAKLFRLSRLEDQCTELMAKIIERVGVFIYQCLYDPSLLWYEATGSWSLHTCSHCILYDAINFS